MRLSDKIAIITGAARGIGRAAAAALDQLVDPSAAFSE